MSDTKKPSVSVIVDCGEYPENREMDGTGSSDEEEEPSGVEQLFSTPQKKNLIPVKVTKVVEPNKIIVKLNEETVQNSVWNEKLAVLFFKHEISGPDDVILQELRPYQDVVVARATDETCAFDEEDVLTEFSTHTRGVILSSESKALFQVFLYDEGVIENKSLVDLSPLKDEGILSKPALFSLVTIPGIVPRKRMDHIPGLASLDLKDIKWRKAAFDDVNSWVSESEQILLRKMVGKSGKKNSLMVGDLYDSKEGGTSLSSFLISKKNVFLNFINLKQINDQ